MVQYGVAEPFRGQTFDFCQEAVANPLQDKAIGSGERDEIVGGLKLERLDPGLELLWWQLLFKMTKTRAPKTIHREADSVVMGGRENAKT